MKTTQLLALFLLLAGTAFAQEDKLLYEQARELYLQREYKPAQRKIEKALRKAPGTSDYLVLKGNILESRRKYTRALETMNQAVQTDTSNFNAYLNRGSLYNTLKDFVHAEQDYQKALTLTQVDSNLALINIYMALNKASTGDFTGEKEHCLRALALDSGNRYANLNLATAEFKLGDTLSSITMLEEMLQADSMNQVARGNLGFFYQQMGEHDKAVRLFTEVLATDKTDAYAYSNRAYSLLILEDTDGAMQDIRKSIRLMPDNAWAYKVRGLIRLKMDWKKRACRDFERAAALQYQQMYGNDINELLIQCAN